MDRGTWRGRGRDRSRALEDWLRDRGIQSEKGREREEREKIERGKTERDRR